MTITATEAFEHPNWISGKFLKVSNLVTPDILKFRFEEYYSPTEYNVSNREAKSDDCTIIRCTYWKNKDESIFKEFEIHRGEGVIFNRKYQSSKNKIETFVTEITKEEFEKVLNEAYEIFKNYDQRTT